VIRIERTKLTPPQLARMWGVTTEKVVTWIKSGELAAIDASTRRNQRPRYLIDKRAVEAFELRRAVVPDSLPAPRSKRPTQGVVEFF
jgi:hypothetical protein